MEMAQLLGLWVHWRHLFGRDSNCLSYKSYGTISLFLASGSWRSEGLFGWSFSVAWSIRHLNGHPGWGPSLSFGSSDA